MQYEYLGEARNVRELIKLLSKVDPSATLTLKDTEETWSFVEILVSEAGDDIMIQ
jgi:hypothetical protein